MKKVENAVILFIRTNESRLKMTTRDKIKKEIDRLPDELLNRVYQFINNLRPQIKKPVKLQTYQLKGQLDDVNVRERAYE